MPIMLYGGGILLDGGKIAIAEACCCGLSGDPCDQCTSGTSPGIITPNLAGFGGVLAPLNNDYTLTQRPDMPCLYQSNDFNYLLDGTIHQLLVQVHFVFTGGTSGSLFLTYQLQGVHNAYEEIAVPFTTPTDCAAMLRALNKTTPNGITWTVTDVT